MDIRWYLIKYTGIQSPWPYHKSPLVNNNLRIPTSYLISLHIIVINMLFPLPASPQNHHSPHLHQIASSSTFALREKREEMVAVTEVSLTPTPLLVKGSIMHFYPQHYHLHSVCHQWLLMKGFIIHFYQKIYSPHSLYHQCLQHSCLWKVLSFISIISIILPTFSIISGCNTFACEKFYHAFSPDYYSLHFHQSNN